MIEIELKQPTFPIVKRIHPRELEVGQALKFVGGNIVVRLATNVYVKFYDDGTATRSSCSFYTKHEDTGRDQGILIPGNVSVTVEIGK